MNQAQFAFGNELIVDLFAGGGGASLGIEQAFGRCVDVAVNHDPEAVAMHQINHPGTEHYVRDVFEVDPIAATRGRQVGLLWASPDCKHFSKAKGGKPRSKKVRGLAWVIVKWAKAVRPRVIMLENVEEFVTWGPLVNGQPCPDRKGFTFRRWKAQLEALGYVIEHREMRACDYGAPTIRKRFFLVARRDGRPIVWPAPTHGKPDSKEVLSVKLLPWRPAAECIDWTRPVHSIFLTKEEARAVGVKRPLAQATMLRIAKGVWRFVITAAKPFLVPIQNYGWGDRCADIDDPMRTVTAGPKGGAFALCAPTLVDVAHSEVSPTGVKRWGSGSHNINEPTKTVVASGGNAALVSAFITKYRPGNAGAPADGPFPTITANGDSSARPGGNPPLAIVAAHLEQANAGGYTGPGHAMTEPVSTVTSTGSQQRLVASTLVKMRGTSNAADTSEPLHTVSAQGTHHAEVRAFLLAYYGNEKDGIDCTDPMRTVVSRERFGLVTVDGTDYAIADIGLRMLTPRELFRAQGFPDSYVIDVGLNGRKLPKDAQVRMCGNSVCPPMSRAMALANCAALIEQEKRSAA